MERFTDRPDSGVGAPDITFEVGTEETSTGHEVNPPGHYRVKTNVTTATATHTTVPWSSAPDGAHSVQNQVGTSLAARAKSAAASVTVQPLSRKELLAMRVTLA